MLAICDAPLRRLSSRAWSPTGSIDMRRRRMQSSPVTLPGRAALAFSSPTRRSASSSFLMRQHDTRILGPAELRARIDRGETGDKVAVAKFGSNVPMKRPGRGGVRHGLRHAGGSAVELRLGRDHRRRRREAVPVSGMRDIANNPLFDASRSGHAALHLALRKDVGNHAKQPALEIR